MKKILLISLTLIIAVSKPCFCEENSVSTDKFLKAIDAGDVNTVKQMLEGNQALANARREGRKVEPVSALYCAIKARNKEIAVLLLAKGANVNDTMYDGVAVARTPLNALFAAAKYDFVEIIPLLATYGANPNQLTLMFGPPLAFAKRADVVRELIKAGAQVNLTDKDLRTPLFYVSSAEAAEALIDAGANVNAEDSRGLTPLFCAGRKKTELLIAHGANVNQKTKIGLTLLENALRGTNEIGKTSDPNVFDTARFLIANGSEYSIEDVARIGDKD
ncbi:MAG: ankyrin repeat domain-containing protein, partial [Sedimentisphaerales bacterium]|nr:ankyrin repeat domain-containing protein [Sedimentisphaerales bacterium]